jgi:hypothetical protein
VNIDLLTRNGLRLRQGKEEAYRQEEDAYRRQEESYVRDVKE